MKISLSRCEYVAKKLGKLNGDKVLDIGCRDMALKNHLQGNFKYVGLDYNPEKKESVDFINHNLEEGLPGNIKDFDIVIALDVLEHLENIHSVFKEIAACTKKKFIVALPNMGHYKFRINFLAKGELSGKYIFSENKTIDRHRWVPNYGTIEKFIKKNTPDNYIIKSYDYIFERKRNFLFFIGEKFLSKFFPSLFVYEKIYFLEKID